MIEGTFGSKARLTLVALLLSVVAAVPAVALAADPIGAVNVPFPGAVVPAVPPVPAVPGTTLHSTTPVTIAPGVEVWITWEKAPARKKQVKKNRKGTRQLQQSCGGGGCVVKEVELIRSDDFVGFNPCPGINETMVVKGTSKVHFFLHFDSSGGIHQIDMDRVAQGTGLTVTGVKYAYSTTFLQHFNLPEPTANATIHIRDRAVRQGELLGLGDDFFLYAEAHITINANGDVTSFFSDIDPLNPPIECR